MSPVESAVPQSLLLKFLADKSTFTLIDARSPAEFAESHIDGAINVPHDQLDAYDRSLPSSPGATVIVYCRTGKRAGKLQAQLTERGFRDVRVLKPGQIFASEALMVFNCGATTEKSLVVNKDAAADAGEEGTSR
jgi:rhodanese-related sulfurtransferase